MDLDYTKYIPKEYLLDGFDATTDSDYYKKMLGDKWDIIRIEFFTIYPNGVKFDSILLTAL